MNRCQDWPQPDVEEQAAAATRLAAPIGPPEAWLRGTAAAQVKDAKISVCQGVGGMFAAAGTVIFGNEA